MLLGPVIFLVLAGVVVMFDPMLVLGEGEGTGERAGQPVPGANATDAFGNHAPRQTQPAAQYGGYQDGRVPQDGPTRPPGREAR